MNKETRLFTSEHVSPGHPDKICDQISDSILDYHYSKSPDVSTRVACETMVKDDHVIVAGEVTTKDRVITYRPIVTDVLSDLGYVSRVSPKFCDSNFQLTQLISRQSQDIAACVDDNELGAGDQGIMFGYAVCEAPDYTGWCHYIARNIVSELWKAKHVDNIIGQPCLCPDYKVQVTIEYTSKQPILKTVLVSASHVKDKDPDEFREAMRHVVRAIIARLSNDEKWDVDTSDYQVLINPYGPFTIFGPIADSGLTGRKIVCDQYGGYAPVGGGAFSGKDLTKVDRTAAYMARFIAKNLLHHLRKTQDSAHAVLPHDCSVEVAYIIGRPEPISINICVEYNDGRRHTVTPEYVMQALFENNGVDCGCKTLYELFKPESIIKNLSLFDVDYSEVSKFGHIGLDTSHTVKPWEMLI